MHTTPTEETHPPQTPADAFSFLRTDHRAIEGLFKGYLASEDDDAKTHLVKSICVQLSVHAMIEEELVYPILRRVSDAVDAALIEHHAAKQLVHDLSTSPATDPLRDAKIAVLFDQIRHHIEEEENEIFAEAQSAGVDVHALGEKLASRKQELVTVLERDGLPVPPAHPAFADADAAAH